MLVNLHPSSAGEKIIISCDFYGTEESKNYKFGTTLTYNMLIALYGRFLKHSKFKSLKCPEKRSKFYGVNKDRFLKFDIVATFKA